MSLSIAAISFAYSTVSLAWTEELGTKANVCKMDDHRNISHHVSTTLNDHGDTRYKTHPKRGSKQSFWEKILSKVLKISIFWYRGRHFFKRIEALYANACKLYYDTEMWKKYEKIFKISGNL